MCMSLRYFSIFRGGAQIERVDFIAVAHSQGRQALHEIRELWVKVESLVAAPPPVFSAAALSPVASASPVFPVELESAEGDTKMVADEVDALMRDFFAKGDVAEDDIYIQFGDTITTCGL